MKKNEKFWGKKEKKITFKPFSYAKKHILQLNSSYRNAILTLYSDTRKDKGDHFCYKK